MHAPPRGLSALLLVLLAFPPLVAQSAVERRAADAIVEPLSWYLPAGVEDDPELPEPAELLGYQAGEWHVRHDQLVQDYRAIAERSPRVRLETYARWHEHRPLLLAAVSMPENLERLEELRGARVEAVLSGAEQHDGPLVLLYHLAAGQGEELELQTERRGRREAEQRERGAPTPPHVRRFQRARAQPPRCEGSAGTSSGPTGET